MLGDSHSLAMEWKGIHELINLAKAPIKIINYNIIEIFKPQGLEIDIQPRLMNIGIPTGWLIQ